MKAKIWVLLSMFADGREQVERVSDRRLHPLDPCDHNISRADANNEGIVGLRVVERFVDLERFNEGGHDDSDELPEWRQPRYRVRVVAYDGSPEAISPMMSLEAAAKMACNLTRQGDSYIDILPPTDDECQPDEEEGNEEAPEAAEQRGELVETAE